MLEKIKILIKNSKFCLLIYLKVIIYVFSFINIATFIYNKIINSNCIVINKIILISLGVSNFLTKSLMKKK